MSEISFKEFTLKNTPANGDFIVGYDVITGEEIKIPLPLTSQARDGASLEIQYSNDAINWFDSFEIGRVFMRQRLGTGAWTNPIQMSPTDEDVSKLQDNITNKLADELGGEITKANERLNDVDNNISSLQDQVINNSTDIATKASEEALKKTDSNVDSLQKFVSDVAQRQVVIDDIKDIDEIKSATLANVVVHQKTSISYYNVNLEDEQTELISVNSGLFLRVEGFEASYNSVSQHNIKQTLSYYNQEGYWVEYMRVYSVFSAAWTNWFQVSKINMQNGKW